MPADRAKGDKPNTPDQASQEHHNKPENIEQPGRRLKEQPGGGDQTPRSDREPRRE